MIRLSLNGKFSNNKLSPFVCKISLNEKKSDVLYQTKFNPIKEKYIWKIESKNLEIEIENGAFEEGEIWILFPKFGTINRFFTVNILN